MTHKEHLKLELMVFAIKHDYFGYGSQCYKRKDNKYVVIIDEERFEYTGGELAKEFDTLNKKDILDIVDYYIDEELNNSN